jgi:predicted  nucleic acid-binding Zn-ribbon protein
MQASPEQQSLVLELQLLDNEIMQANTKLKSLPEVEQLLHIDKRIITATDEVATVKQEADQITLELRRGEVDVETVTDRIKKDEARLASGNATPKELEQTQHEIQTLKKRQLALEEIELEIMVRSEAVTERSKVLTTDLASLETLKAEIDQRLTTASGEINTVIINKQSDREKVVAKIEKPLLDLYEKIRTASGGVAAAALVGNKCNGCNLAINAVEMERIKSLAKDELLRCEECRRILVRI